MTLHTTTQGGRKFEISWEPNFPVNNFARNNGNKSDMKSQQMCVIFHHILKLGQRCAIFTPFLYQMEYNIAESSCHQNNVPS